MPIEPSYLLFRADRLDEVVAVMEQLAEAHDGWMNVEPVVDEDEPRPSTDGFFGIFGGRGPDVPLATWLPATAPRRGRPEPPKIGLQHGAGTRAKPRLAELGHPIPDGWVVVQDYIKKGLVIAVPPTVAHADVLGWLVGAARALSSVRITSVWRAEVYRP